MNDQAMAVPVVVRERAKRVRRVKGVQDRLFDLALSHWGEWLLNFHVPRRVDHRAASAREMIAAWAMVTASARVARGPQYEASLSSSSARAVRSNVEHSDSVLAQIMAEERAGWDWAVGMHAIVVSLSKPWQAALFCRAMGHTTTIIGAAAGVQQRHVCILMDNIREVVLPAMYKLPSTARECHARLGCGLPPLQFR